ncbi:calcium sensor EFh, partial [Pseudomonas sp. ATCC 13867]
MPIFFKDLYNEIDAVGDKNGEVTPQELKEGLRAPDLRERWSKLVA